MCVTSSSYRQPDSKNLLALALIEIQHATWPFLAFFPTLGGEPLWPKTSGAPVHYECWTQVIASLCRNPKQHVQWAIVRRHGAAKNNITWRQSCGTKLFAYYYGFAKECIDVTVSVYEILLIHHNGILRGEVYFGLVRVLENTHHRTSISQKKQQPPKMFPSILIYCVQPCVIPSQLRPSSHWVDSGIVWLSESDAIGHIQDWLRMWHCISLCELEKNVCHHECRRESMIHPLIPIVSD